MWMPSEPDSTRSPVRRGASRMRGSLRAWPKRDSQGLVLAKRAVLLSHGPHSHKLLTMGSSYLAVVMAHLQRADALAHSFHGEALFISVDQDGLYGGLQIFLTNDDWILRNLIGNVGRFVAQPRVLAWVDIRLKHLKVIPYLFSAPARSAKRAPSTPHSQAHGTM